MKPRSLSSLFSPSSVAVVGASDDPRKWGNWLARGALRGESRRAVHLVNHRAGEVLGRSSYGTLAELPQSPELVVIAVPVRALSEVVDDALEAGARAIVAISAGDNASAGTAQRDALLAARVRATGAVLLGPNCLGVFDAGEQLELVTNPLPPGSIGLISQSGNLALELGLLAARRGLGFSRFVSLGNQADLGAAEFVAELASHPPTKLIALYVEDFRDGREFARACVQAAEIGKPVVAIAIERGQATARAVDPTREPWRAKGPRSTRPASPLGSNGCVRHKSSLTSPRRCSDRRSHTAPAWRCSVTAEATAVSPRR